VGVKGHEKQHTANYSRHTACMGPWMTTVTGAILSPLGIVSMKPAWRRSSLSRDTLGTRKTK